MEFIKSWWQEASKVQKIFVIGAVLAVGVAIIQALIGDAPSA